MGQRRKEGERRRKSGKKEGGREREGIKERGTCVWMEGAYADKKEETHANSVDETRQSKATTSEDNSFFSRAASGGIQTHNILHTVQMLYQLSHQGSSTVQAESLKFTQGKGHLSPDDSISVVRST